MICQLDSCYLLPQIPFVSTDSDTNIDTNINTNINTNIDSPFPIPIIKIDNSEEKYLHLKINPDETITKIQLDNVKEIFDMLEGTEMIKIELIEYFEKNIFSKEDLFEDILKKMVQDYQHGLLFGILRSFYNIYNESSYSLVMDYEYTPYYEEIFSIAVKDGDPPIEEVLFIE